MNLEFKKWLLQLEVGTGTNSIAIVPTMLFATPVERGFRRKKDGKKRGEVPTMLLGEKPE